MGYKIYDIEYDFNLDYEDIYEFLDDYVTSEIVEAYINDIYGMAELPIIGKVPFGKLVFAIIDDTQYNELREELISIYTDIINETIDSDGQIEFDGYLIRREDGGE